MGIGEVGVETYKFPSCTEGINPFIHDAGLVQSSAIQENQLIFTSTDRIVRPHKPFFAQRCQVVQKLAKLRYGQAFEDLCPQCREHDQRHNSDSTVWVRYAASTDLKPVTLEVRNPRVFISLLPCLRRELSKAKGFDLILSS